MRQRRMVLVLVFINIILLVGYLFFDHFISPKKTYVQTEPSYRKIYDSLVKSSQARQAEIKPFNPNFLSDYRAYVLGIDTVALKKIRAFRSKGKFFQSKEAFKKIAGIDDSLFQKLEPYIRIPVFRSQKKKTYQPFYKTGNEPKTDINTATKEQLMQVYGIGDKLSNRIIHLRNKLGGFTIREQLKDIYALSPEAYNNLWKKFEILTPKKITRKIPLNSADIITLAENPYIDQNLAEKIYEYRSLHGSFKSFEELKKIPGFPQDKFRRIVLYLELK